MNSVPVRTDLTPAQRRELLNMVRTRNRVGDRPELPPIRPSADEELDRLLGAQP